MYLILMASPNSNGLTAASAEAVKQGIASLGKQAETVSLHDAGITGCRACGDGWGKCRTEHACVIDDGFAALAEKLFTAEGAALVTPVYWGQPAERMQYFLIRLRRCQALRREENPLAGKRFTLVAAAGGSGNGTISCLAEMEQWCRHLGAVPVERIGITRFNREEMLSVIRGSGIRLARE